MVQTSNIGELITAEQQKLETLLSKREALDKRIKGVKTNIEKYEIMQSKSQSNILSSVLANAGVSFEDIITALSSGDIPTLQQKIEHAKMAASTEPPSEQGTV